jgi:hypothetical protein
MKRITGDLGEMKIPLKPGAKLIRKSPYKINMRYKENVKVEIDMMIDTYIIEPVEESEWISPMVVRDKKIEELVSVWI